MAELNDLELNTQLAERFKQLPKAVQDAIQSADIEAHLRALADTHKLHVDQWEALENEVMLALLGFQPVEDLEKNIEKHVNVAADVAKPLAADISRIVFEPVREQLERELQNPDAKAVQVNTVEAAGAQAIAQEHAAQAAPEAPQSQKRAERAVISESYKAGETSSTRKDVHNDPYRETP